MKNFYSKVLPTEGLGVYCVSALNSKEENPSMYNTYVKTIDKVVETIEEHKKDKEHVFTALGVFNAHSRKGKHLTHMRSFFIDLDVGEKKKYKTKEEAHVALREFLTKHNFLEPIWVDSGNGLHAYWALDGDVVADEWRPIASAFKDFCQRNELHIDPAITADGSRIMRCPYTENHKSDPPNPTFVITDESEWQTYSLDEFKKSLSVDGELSLAEIASKAEHNFLTEEQKEYIEFKNSNYQYKFTDILKNSLQGNEDGCAQIKHCIDNRKHLEEPMWWRLLSIAQHCEERDTAIHLVSKDYKGYSEEETELKASQTQGMPHTCDSFDKENPGICDSCPSKGKIKSPLLLGRTFIKLAPAEEPIQEVIEVDEETQQTSIVAKFSGLPQSLTEKGFMIGAGQRGGIYRQVTMPGKNGEKPTTEEFTVYEYNLYPTKHINSTIEGRCLLVTVEHPQRKPEEFLLPMKYVTAKDKLRDTLMGHGVYYSSSAQENMIMQYFIEWGKDYVAKGKCDSMYDQMGWIGEDRESFIWGKKEIKRSGEIIDSPPSPLCKNIIADCIAQGSYEEWKSAAQKLNQNGLELHAFTMLAGFASTLMNYTSTSGVTISLTGESGAAKTGALYGALSVWGHPKNLAVLDSTFNGLRGRFLSLHNLPFGVDEVSNKSAPLLSELIHAISQGKSKIKMQGSINAEREHEASASLIGILTSNHSVYDKLTGLKLDPNGEVARLIEFEVRKPKAFMDDAKLGKEIFDKLRVNFGWAGPEFIRCLYEHGDDKINERIDHWIDKFREDFGNDTAYRFYENLMAVTMTAGEILDKFDIVSYELNRIYKYVVGEMIAIRDNVVKVNNIDYESLLTNYVNNNIDKILAFGENKPHPFREPQRSLSIRIENDTGKEGMMWLAKKEFDEYLRSLPVSTKEFLYQMKQLNINVTTNKKRMNAGWQDFNKSATYAYMIDMSTLPKDMKDGVKKAEAA